MLKNYTSAIPATRSITYIETKLAKHGANQILKQYDPSGRVSNIRFSIVLNDRDYLFSLPAQVQNCEKVLRETISNRARPETRKKIPAQAERTAWKILADWVDAQMAMIELAQVDVLEVFLPYVYNPQTRQTFYNEIKSTKYKALLESRQS